MRLLSINLMLFDPFRCLFVIGTQKSSKFDMVYKVFLINFSGCSKMLWDQCFFDISRSRETPSTLSEKPNAFLITSGAILRFGLQNDQNSIGFIRF